MYIRENHSKFAVTTFFINHQKLSSGWEIGDDLHKPEGLTQKLSMIPALMKVMKGV